MKGTGESMTRVDLPIPLMYHDQDKSWITDPDLDHPKGTQPASTCTLVRQTPKSHLYQPQAYKELHMQSQ